MSLKLHLAELPVERVACSYSVLYELLVSLRVLDDFKHHPLHITWALETLKQLPPEFRAEQRFFRVILRHSLYLLWKPDYAQEPSYERELQTFSEWELERFAEPIIMTLTYLGQSSCRRMLKECLTLTEFCESEQLQMQARENLTEHCPDSLGIVDLLIDDPQALKQRFINFLHAYWEAQFCQKWAMLEAHFLQEVMERGQLLYQHGIVMAFEKLTPHVFIDQTEQIVTFGNLSQDEQVIVTKNSRLDLYPSYFLYPSMFFVIENHEVSDSSIITITYPMPEIQRLGRSPILSDELLTMIRALSDPTRMQIIKLIANQARSTSELAKIIGVSDAAISKHLKLLQSGGWVTSKRESYYVLYQANADPLQDLQYALRELFE